MQSNLFVKRVLPLVMALSVIGCWDSQSVQIVEEKPSALFCFIDKEDSENESVGPETSLELLVLDPCYSPGLELIDALCTVDVVGQVINVTSTFEYLQVSEFAASVCRQEYTRCGAASLPSLDGEYTLVHGDVERSIEFPSDSNLDCSRVRQPIWDRMAGRIMYPVTGEIREIEEYE